MWPYVQITVILLIFVLVLIPNLVFLYGHFSGIKNRIDIRLKSYLLEQLNLDKVRPEI